MNTLERVAWLFVRGDEAIRVDVSADGLRVAANGPGYERRIYKFGDEPTANEFIRLYEHSLAGAGWALQAFVERRAGNAPESIPEGGDRRRRSQAVN